LEFLDSKKGWFGIGSKDCGGPKPRFKGPLLKLEFGGVVGLAHPGGVPLGQGP